MLCNRRGVPCADRRAEASLFRPWLVCGSAFMNLVPWARGSLIEEETGGCSFRSSSFLPLIFLRAFLALSVCPLDSCFVGAPPGGV